MPQDILVASGETEEVVIDRGTMQGDSLSPLMFIIFMEPLLRWLQPGGRGNKLACSEDKKQMLLVGSHAYADDLNALSNTAADMEIKRIK